MEDKNIEKENKIVTINDLFLFMQKEIQYGWLDQSGNKHEGINDAKTFCLQSPEELMKNKLGICWDMTELVRYFFETETDLKYETYYLFYDDNRGCPSHSIFVFYKDNKVYWFEPMFQNEKCYYSGIHEYFSISNLLEDFKIKFIESSLTQNRIPRDYDRNRFYLYRYDKPNYHINGYQMREHINNSTLIEEVGDNL